MEENIQGYRSLSHSKWDCKYHVVFYTKEETESPVWAGTLPAERNLSCFGTAEGVPDSGRSSDA